MVCTQGMLRCYVVAHCVWVQHVIVWNSYHVFFIVMTMLLMQLCTAVKVQSFSVVFTIALDLLAYQARCHANVIKQGGHLPRTRCGWLTVHYTDTIKCRNNGILQAVQNFNRSRPPLDTTVFTGPRQYARCMAPIEVPKISRYLRVSD